MGDIKREMNQNKKGIFQTESKLGKENEGLRRWWR